MEIDLQTIKELELLKNESSGANIFEMIDFTATAGGKYKFKKLFRKPFSEIKLLRKRQAAIKHIAENVENWELPVDNKLMDRLDVYYFSESNPSMNSNVFIRFVESVSYRFIYKDFKTTFLEGSRYLIQFLKLINKYINRLDNNNLPELLQEYVLHILEHLSLKEIQAAILIKSIKNTTKVELLKCDKVFRDSHKDKVLDIIDMLYEIDVLVAQAKANLNFDLNFPEFIESEQAVFKSEALYHLFVINPVVNNLNFQENENFIFLTGPNMAGKTTFLKSCGLAVFMAHLGMGVAAKSLKLSTFNQLFTSLNVSDNLSKGYSYFYNEVRRVKQTAEILQKSKKTFIIFDELFKGTNIKDAFEGSLKVIQKLIEWKSSLFILSSHLLELGNVLKLEKGIGFRYFDSKVENGKPVFYFQLKNGLSDAHLGLLILENEHVFELLTEPESKKTI